MLKGILLLVLLTCLCSCELNLVNLLPQKKVKKVRKGFDKHDKDGDGNLDFEELKGFLGTSGDDPEKELKGIMKEYDYDENNKLDFDEFNTFYFQGDLNLLMAIAEKLFKIDTNTDETIDKEEFEKYLESVKQELKKGGKAAKEKLEYPLTLESAGQFMFSYVPINPDEMPEMEEGEEFNFEDLDPEEQKRMLENMGMGGMTLEEMEKKINEPMNFEQGERPMEIPENEKIVDM